MPTVGPTELIIILVIVLVLFGAGKLGDVGSALGKTVKGFREATAEEVKPEGGSTATQGPSSPEQIHKEEKTVD